MSVNLDERYREAWQSCAAAPDVFAFLSEHHASTAADKLTVVLTDQQLRWLTDNPLKVEEYLARIPELTADPELTVELAVGEYQARQDRDDSPSLEEFSARFADIGSKLQDRLRDMASGGARDDATASSPTQSVACDSTISDQQIGRYRLMRKIGEGSFGIVYLAYDEELQRTVAIKVPTSERFQQLVDADAYLNEARTAASLDHPNIVPVYDLGRTDDGSIYIVSKFIEGRTLADRIKQNRPDHEEAARLLVTIARSLQHAHERKLTHRDIKPGNILLEDSTDTPYVADFGLAIREVDHVKVEGIAGTPAYMSPEQARGEGHRVDGRSDIFSLGVVFYELLTGKKPFRGSTANEVLHRVVSVDPPNPRQLDESIPIELERICLKALSKRASDRYTTADALADDLSRWRHEPEQYRNAVPIVPKGLRSFDADDADFFLDLLAGPRTRDGLPESIHFWKTRIEETDPDATFSVGLIYGPSGCGKSSLMKAGLLPRLSADVVAVHVEATPAETEARILRGLCKRVPEIPKDLGLVETFTLLRQRRGSKVVLVLDQFEQWLHAHRAEPDSELVRALRQCDGGALQAIVLVRDDFAMAAARFMDSLDVRVVQGHNFATIDLFDLNHAEKVLTKFGQAFGKLPADPNKLTDQQREFVATASSGLSQDGRVVSVRLALFAEMIKGKPWVPATLEEVGGTEGVGVNFLEETFSSRTANPRHRLQQQAAREVLRALLPEVGSDIKGHMRSHAQLLEASGYEHRRGEFNDLLRTLDGELRLITPTDPEGSQSESGVDLDSKFYQLTHDYLVPSLRGWLTRKQQETRTGRAELRLAERSSLWNAKPENRHLPSLLEWISIRTWTDRRKWTALERELMRKAGRVYGMRLMLSVALLLGIVFAGISLNRNAIARRNEVEATRLVEGLPHADTSQLATVLDSLADYRTWAADDLAAAYADWPDDSNAKLHAALALLPGDRPVREFLQGRLLTVSPGQFATVRDLLENHRAELSDDYWLIADDTQQEPALRFQAACALARFDSEHERWSQEEFGEFVAEYLVNVFPSELLPWRNALLDVKEQLVSPLAVIYRDEEVGEQARLSAAETLAEYRSDDADYLFDLLADASNKQFLVILAKLMSHRGRAIELAEAELEKSLEHVEESDKEALAIRHANSAALLLRMGVPEHVWPLLAHSTDPRVRSYLIHWLSPLQCDPREVIARYREENDLSTKRALLLGLGEFDDLRLPPSERDALTKMLLGLYQTAPDSGLHGAVEWLLRRWGQGEQLADIDVELKQTEDQLRAATADTRQWYINGQGQTFVILDAGEFLMGSTNSETDREPDETIHRRMIGRRFAISSKEVNRAQWQRFQQDVGSVMHGGDPEPASQARSEESSMTNMTWYQAAWYCNWLSDREGIEVPDWCYEPDEENGYGPGMKAKTNHLELSGYRLPTEPEWEFACRAGARTRRYYGETDTLLSHYAWSGLNGQNRTWPGAELKPNDFGLFDMLGNSVERCYDAYYEDYPAASGDPVADRPETVEVLEAVRRVVRGGAFNGRPAYLRSADRYGFQPTNHDSAFGFRLARTFRLERERSTGE